MLHHVHLVDDEPDVLDAHRFVLSVAGFRVSTFASAEAFLKNLDARDVGCVVMDLRMQGLSGLECLDIMRREGLDMPVLFVTGHGDMISAVAALKNGAADFIAKPIQAEKLVEACTRLCAWHETERSRMASVASIRSRLDRLTVREREVAGLVAEGLANKVIADRLGVTEQAVKYHRMNICSKLDVKSAVEIARLLDAGAGVLEETGLRRITVLE